MPNSEAPVPKKPWLQTVPGILTAASTSVVAIAAIIGALTPAAELIREFFQPKGCFNRAGYPVGRRAMQDLRTSTPATYSTFITFTGPQDGTWLASAGPGSFTASNVPLPNTGVVLTLKPEGDNKYQSTSKLIVSADGCRLEGTFGDTEGHFGEVVYTFAGEQKPSR